MKLPTFNKTLLPPWVALPLSVRTVGVSICWLVGALLLSAGIGKAQSPQAVLPMPLQRIIYVRHLPTPVERAMPRHASSCFAGAFKLTPTGEEWFLNFYDPKPEPDLKSDYHYHDFVFVVALFKIANTKGGKHYRFIRSFPVQYPGFVWAPNLFAAQLLWLDPRDHTKPILKFDCFLQGEYGPLGHHVLVVFPDGILGHPMIQSIEYGSWHASGSVGQDNAFDSIDAHGLLQIRETLYYGMAGVEDGKVILKWNGKKFADPLHKEAPGHASQADNSAQNHTHPLHSKGPLTGF